jgi:hypothetical protein
MVRCSSRGVTIDARRISGICRVSRSAMRRSSRWPAGSRTTRASGSCSSRLVPDHEQSAFRPGTLLQTLVSHQVRFVIVGGFAGRLHGGERPTTDLDICPAWNSENLERLTGALRDLDAALRLRPDLEPTIVRPNPDLLREFSVTLWRTPAGNLDVLLGVSTAPGSLVCFPELRERATELELNDGALFVAGLEDLIAAREVANRPKDRQALHELRALRAARRLAIRDGLHQTAQAAPSPQHPARLGSPRAPAAYPTVHPRRPAGGL